MSTLTLDPIVSEFETQQQADDYDQWYRAQVQAALDDPRPAIPHEEAMKLLDQRIAERKAKRVTARC
ncbi:MAG: stability determinant [Lautropia sp.]|nr:stability determinant [Lautropia sp.]